MALALFLLPLLSPRVGLALREVPTHPAAARAAGELRMRQWELGLGIQGAWPHLVEAAPVNAFALDEGARAGLVIEGTRRLTPFLGLFVELATSGHPSNLPDVDGSLTTLACGLRYQLVKRGGLRPYLRGSIAAAQAKIRGEDDEDESLKLDGLAGIFGGGLRLATSPRLQFNLELSHAVINYRDASVTLENIYTGTRIDKAGSVTRLQFTLLWLI